MTQQITKESLRRLMVEGRDLLKFFELLGIIPNGAHRRWAKVVGATEMDEWLFRSTIHQAANQVGKTLGLAVADLWASHNKIGVPHDNEELLLRMPYLWLHLGPTLGTSRKMLYTDLIPVLEGNHPAQFDKETKKFRPCLFPREFWQETNFEKEYPGITLWNGSEIHFRTTDDEAKGVSQMVANGISVDEAALEVKLKSTTAKTLRMRVAANNGPIWFVGTPDGPNDFAEMIWSVEDNGEEVEDRVFIDGERREALIRSDIYDNVGYGITAEEAEYQERTQDPATREAKLRGAILFPAEAFFTPPTAILQAWVPNLRARERPTAGHRYAIFWDVSVASDPTVLIVLDITRKPWRAVRFRRWERPMGTDSLLQAMEAEHRFWSSGSANEAVRPWAITGFDATAMGGAMFNDLLRSIRPRLPVNFGGPKAKTQMLTNLRTMMARRELVWPSDWLVLKKEIMGYRLDDKHIRQDAVMAAAGAVETARHAGHGTAVRRPFRTGWVEGVSLG